MSFNANMDTVKTVIITVATLVLTALPARADNENDSAEHGRNPIDLVLSQDGTWLVTANEASGTISLIRTRDGAILDEVACGDRPAAIVARDANSVVVTNAYSGDVKIFRVADDQLKEVGSIHVGFEPKGIAVSPDGNRAYIGHFAASQVAVCDLESLTVVQRIDVGKWPRYLTLSPDGHRLAVGCSGDNQVTVVDTDTGKALYSEPLTGGINLGHMRSSADGQYAYFTWMVYRNNPITPGNIRLGWVLASRIGRVRFDGPSYREAISLDVPRRAVADPFGLDIAKDGKRMVVSSSGTHELLVYRLPDLPFVGVGGPGDLIDRRLLADRDMFYRIELGGRPMGLRIASDNRTVYVANYLRDSVQVVDLEEKKLLSEVFLSDANQSPSLARRGMAIYYDAGRSLDQWYSCHSCHQDGGTNSKPMDTWNDGTERTTKTVLPLYGLARTGPWTWHGWQTSLTDAMHKSFKTTMQGKAPPEDDVRALLAYLDTLQLPPNPMRGPDGSLSVSAERGRRVFQSAAAGCMSCHNGDRFTDGEIHDVGLGSPKDRYQGYNTPSLTGVYRKVRFLHHGRAKSLESVLRDFHSPTKTGGQRELSARELDDLVAYLMSL